LQNDYIENLVESKLPPTAAMQHAATPTKRDDLFNEFTSPILVTSCNLL